MSKPKILVTGAAGRTGSETVLQLLKKGYPVKAFVKKNDTRAAALRNAGAEIHIGNLFDFRDLSVAMHDVQRAYHCPPFAPNLLEGNMAFALAANDARLEIVALMSGWNDHESHPSIVTRQHWIAKQLYRWMPSVDVIHINPGLFAFVYLLGLPAIVHFGLLMGPFGNGKNAPPSNEDIAKVAASVLTNPGPHIGKSYRPTGPELLSPDEIADVLGKILNRKVKYQDASFNMFIKAAKGLGFPDFEISQIRYYAKELRHGAYEIGAPTAHVEHVTGQKPESFNEIARRYINNPSLIHPTLKTGNKLDALTFMFRMLTSRVVDYDRWEQDRNHPILTQPLLAHENRDWLTTARNQHAHILENIPKQNIALKHTKTA